jgi:hypothetical protein
MVGRVLLQIVDLLVRQIPGLVALLIRRDMAKDAELLGLRHENAVLRRPAGKVRYEPADRLWLAALARELLGRGVAVDLTTDRPRYCQALQVADNGDLTELVELIRAALISP